jgi:outer membrane PBP1 activator LpoA protein
VQPTTLLNALTKTPAAVLIACAALATAGCAAAPTVRDTAASASPAARAGTPPPAVPGPAAAAAPSPGSAPVTPIETPAPAPQAVALVLPLTGRMAPAGTALRDGFMTAWYRADEASRPEIRVYDTGPGAAEAYRRAIAEGAGFVVGPLAKEDVLAVARLADGSVGTLVLNFLPDGETVPSRLYQFALSPEDEARQVAERLIAEGKRVGIALVPSGEWGSRVINAFQGALEAGGGAVVARQSYGAQTMDYSDLITAMLGFNDSRRRHQQLVSTLGQTLEFSPRRREDVQFIFVAGQPTQGRLIRPQLKFHFAGDLPVYATSDVFDPNPTANADLDGVTFPDTPWMISTDPAIAGLREEMNAFGVQNVRRWGRLYAMGYDAFALVHALRDPRALSAVPVRGATGQLTLGADGRVRRTLDWAVIGPDGHPRPLPPTAAVGPSMAPATAPSTTAL